MQRHPVLPTLGERVGLVVGREHHRQVRQPEERQHRQVDLAVPAVRRGVDDPGRGGGAGGGAAGGVGAPQHVAVPQVAVQAGRWLVGQQHGQAADQPLDGGDVGVGDGAAVAGQLEVGQHPAHGVELRPGVGAALGQRQPGDEPVTLGAVRRRTGAVGGGQRAAQVGGGLGADPAGLDPAQDHAVAVGGQQGRHLHALGRGLGEPAQAGGLGLEEAGGCLREGLHQRRGAVGEPQLGGAGHVAAGDRGGGDHGGAEELLGATGDHGLARHGRPVACCSAETSAALVRSTMASTSSNPWSPP